MFSEQDYIDLFRLSQINGLGNSRIRTLISFFKSPTNVFETNPAELSALSGINSDIAVRISQEKSNKIFLDYSEKLYTANRKYSVNTVCYWDENYPFLLKNIYDAPNILFYRGKFPSGLEDAFAFVGTRTPTNYGKNMTEKLVKEFADFKVIIASGFARGIDSIAHKTAIKYGLTTIAVFGCGLNVIYPPENKILYDEILENGCLISEYPIGTKPLSANFPKRNRIVSGISLATIIVESDVNGGALLTAKFALDQNRNVFSVPGNVGIKQSKGTNLLIQKGEAKLVTSASDILEEYLNKFQNKGNKAETNIQLNIFEEKIFSVLSKEQMQIDIIADKTGLQTSECLVGLLNLEFYGLVKQLPGKMFIRF